MLAENGKITSISLLLSKPSELLTEETNQLGIIAAHVFAVLIREIPGDTHRLQLTEKGIQEKPIGGETLSFGVSEEYPT